VPLRNNNVDGATDKQIRYVTDIDNGSFGPPLLTDDWVVCASAVCPLSALRSRPDPVMARPTRCRSHPSKLTTFTTRAYTSPGLQAW
jgi:hypothetical protein